MSRSTSRVGLFLLLLTGLTAGAAGTVDYPVVGTHLTLRNPPYPARGALNVVLKDPSIPVPVPGSPDDPSVDVVQVFLFGHASGQVESFYTIPSPDQWDVRSTPNAITYGYLNTSASPLCCDLQRVHLRTGSGLRLRAKTAGLTLDAPEGAVGVRVEWGSIRVCAIFDGDAVRQDANYRFVARNAEAPAITDCNDDTLNGP
jgi:hypothetical protein